MNIETLASDCGIHQDWLPDFGVVVESLGWSSLLPARRDYVCCRLKEKFSDPLFWSDVERYASLFPEGGQSHVKSQLLLLLGRIGREAVSDYEWC